jgi:hypothetical protein
LRPGWVENYEKTTFMTRKNSHYSTGKLLYLQQNRLLPAIMLPQPYENEDYCLLRSISNIDKMFC